MALDMVVGNQAYRGNQFVQWCIDFVNSQPVVRFIERSGGWVSKITSIVFNTREL